ncbi:MAG: haloacetate dehalogenase, partial [Actinomycetota bacterium]|nr:haloacetate dehalogenase [Actinomycetota bacterium]
MPRPADPTPADVAEYVRLPAAGVVRGARDDHRAGAQDGAQDGEGAGRTLSCPVLALWGKEFAGAGHAFDGAAIRAKVAADLRTVELE